MDAFTAQFDRVRRQLAALNGSQRMLVGTLVAIMAATVLYWGKYAAAPEMVPVLDQPLTDEDVAPIVHRLEASGIAHAVSAGKVLVPADRRSEVLAQLMYAQELPRDTHWAFDDMTAKELNPFSSQTEREAVYNHAKEMELSRLIQHFPGVADARVVINAKNERHIEGSIPPTATVFITARNADAGHARQLVQAAADGVVGAVSGMAQQNIRVIVNGVSLRPAAAAGPDAGIAATDAMELQEKGEAAFEQKIHNLFSFIPGLTVNVTCEVETASRVETKQTYDKAGVISVPTMERTQTSEQRTAGDASHEPGAATNDGTAALAAVDGGGAGGGAVAGPVTTSSTNDEQTHTENFVPNSKAEIVTPAGKITIRSASVNVPMSYVARRFRATSPAGKDPTPAELQLASAAETARLREQVSKVVGLPTVENVVVDTFADDAGVTPTADLAMAASPAATSAALGGLAGHAKEIAVGTLAVISLGMMFQMARRGGPALPPFSPAPSLAGLGASVAYGGGQVGGDDGDDHDDRGVTSTSTLTGGMEGMELDADTVRTQQMLDQVSTLVKEDPDAAAALVKRWVSRA